MTKKDPRVFLYKPPGEEPIELVNLMDGGPLCIGRAVERRDVRPDLFWIYLKKQGARIGPYFADIHLAFKSMRKLVNHFGVPFFEQPLDWIRRALTKDLGPRKWCDRNIGEPGDLIGGQWSKD